MVVGAFISIGFSYTFTKSITVFFEEIEGFFHASASEVSWIFSIMLVVMYGGGPISNILASKYGGLPIMILGGCLSALACSQPPSATQSSNFTSVLVSLEDGVCLQPESCIDHDRQAFLQKATVGQWTGHGRQSCVSLYPAPPQSGFL